MLKLSHISCRVDNLEDASKKFTEMGFKIEWGSNSIEKSNNFFIWLDDGPFLEIFTIKKRYLLGGIGLLLLYGRLPTKKWWYWYNAKNSWCDFALEDFDFKNTSIEYRNGKTLVNIEKTKQELMNKGFKVSKKTMHWSRKNFKNKRAYFSFFVFQNIRLPFIVSRYEPNQKPLYVNHMNGSTKLGYICIYSSDKDYKEMKIITENDNRIIVRKGEKTCIKEIGIIGINKEVSFCEINFKPVIK